MFMIHQFRALVYCSFLWPGCVLTSYSVAIINRSHTKHSERQLRCVLPSSVSFNAYLVPPYFKVHQSKKFNFVNTFRSAKSLVILTVFGSVRIVEDLVR